MEFGDRVRVKDTPESTRAGLAGREGDIFGFTTPSVSGVDVIGSIADDYALSVGFEDIEDPLWFAQDQLDMVGVNPGMEITLDGVDAKWTRSDSGDWVESNSKPWWKFWS